MTTVHPDYAKASYDRPSIVLMWISMTICVLASVAATGFLMHMGDNHSIDGITLWVISPMAGAAVLAVLLRRDRAGSVITLLASILAAALMGVELHDISTSRSSTAALGLLVIPIMLWGVVLLAGGIVVVIRILRRFKV